MKGRGLLGREKIVDGKEADGLLRKLRHPFQERDAFCANCGAQRRPGVYMGRQKRPIIVFLMAGFLFAGTAQAADDTSTVKGVVGTYVGHNQAQGFTFVPYEKGLDVKLEGPNGFVRDTTSDNMGNFSFSNVPVSSAQYVISVRTKCLVPVVWEDFLVQSSASGEPKNVTVSVQSGFATVSVKFGLPPCLDAAQPGVGVQQPPPYRGGTIPATSASCGRIDLTDKTVDIDLPTAQRALVRVTNVSSHGDLYLRFDTTDWRIRALQARQVLFLEHLGAGRVAQVSYDGDGIVVHLTPAKLTDFILSGTLTFPPTTGRCAHAKDPQAVTQWVLSKGPASATTGHFYWQYSAGATGGKTVNYHFVAYKKAPRFDGSVTADGTLESGQSGHGLVLNVAITTGLLQKFEYEVPLAGHLDVKWNVAQHAAGGGEPGDSRLIILPFYQEVLDIDKIPFLFQVSANVIFTPGIGEPKAALQGAYHIQYGGTGGIQGGTDLKDQAVGKLTATTLPTADHVVSSALASHGVVVAVNAPKVAFSFGPQSFLYAIKNQVPGEAGSDAENEAAKFELDQYTQTMSGVTPAANFFKTNNVLYAMWVNEYDYSSNGQPTFNLIKCRAEHIRMIGSVGASASFLGTMGTLKDDQIYNKVWTKLSSNSKQARAYCGWR